MKIVNVYLPDVSHVQKFVGALSPLRGNFVLCSEGRTLDARSLMGILDFDLSKPIQLRVYDETPENLGAIKPFVAEGERV